MQTRPATDLLSSTQKGAIAEAVLSAALTLHSGGRISCFHPMADDDGIDLLAYNKQTRRAVSLQIKSRAMSGASVNRTVQFDVREATWRAGETGFCIGVVMDGLTVSHSWLFPMTEVAALGNLKKGVFVLTPSLAAGSKDKYAACRQHSVEDLVAAIVRLTEQ